jgi:hypothetical protein
VESTPQPHPGVLQTGGAYALLFLLGALLGLIGCFQFSLSAGPVPVAALVLCAVIFVTCLLAGIGMESARGALAPAAGWLVASLVLTLPTGGGSVIVTSTAAGLWYMYGGALSAAAGVIAIVAIRARAAIRRGPGTPS